MVLLKFHYLVCLFINVCFLCNKILKHSLVFLQLLPDLQKIQHLRSVRVRTDLIDVDLVRGRLLIDSPFSCVPKFSARCYMSIKA